MSARLQTGINWRVLPAEEWDRVEHLFIEHGAKLPPKGMATIIVAEVLGDIVFMAAPVTVVHVENMYAHPDYRETGLVSVGCGMVDALLNEQGLAGYYSFVSQGDEKMAHLAERCGLTELPYRIFLKDFQRS